MHSPHILLNFYYMPGPTWERAGNRTEKAALRELTLYRGGKADRSAQLWWSHKERARRPRAGTGNQGGLP